MCISFCVYGHILTVIRVFCPFYSFQERLCVMIENKQNKVVTVITNLKSIRILNLTVNFDGKSQNIPNFLNTKLRTLGWQWHLSTHPASQHMFQKLWGLTWKRLGINIGIVYSKDFRLLLRNCLTDFDPILWKSNSQSLFLFKSSSLYFFSRSIS